MKKTDNFTGRISRLAPRRQLFTLHSSLLTSRRGFTLIEILVASLLLGMLMTILTMIFNSSSIAWRTGRASVSSMSKARKQLSYAEYVAENALPRIDQGSASANGRILGAWDKDGKPRKRAVENFSSWPFSPPSWTQGSAGSSPAVPWAQITQVDRIKNGKGGSYSVGVWSYGPDGKSNTKDDIVTGPMDVQ